MSETEIIQLDHVPGAIIHSNLLWTIDQQLEGIKDDIGKRRSTSTVSHINFQLTCIYNFVFSFLIELHGG